MRDRRPKRRVTSPARNVSWGMVCLFFCLFIFEVLTLATDYNSTKPLCQSRGLFLVSLLTVGTFIFLSVFLLALWMRISDLEPSCLSFHDITACHCIPVFFILLQTCIVFFIYLYCIFYHSMYIE
jgi:hypothetical protein